MLKLELYGDDITFTYINWKGIKGERTVKPWEIYYGSTEYHPEEQWLMEAFDYDKKASRTFAMKDMSNVKKVPKK